MLTDMGKAHLSGPTETVLFVELPGKRATPGKAARSKFMLYGMRMAAKKWEKEYSRTPGDLGFAKGAASSVAFHNNDTIVPILVHGDAFIMSGVESELWKVHDALSAKYIVKVRGLLGSRTRRRPSC